MVVPDDQLCDVCFAIVCVPVISMSTDWPEFALLNATPNKPLTSTPPPADTLYGAVRVAAPQERRLAVLRVLAALGSGEELELALQESV